MSDVVRLDKARKQRRKANAQGKTLCGRGFHRWRIDTKQRFDVKLGRLVTTEVCERCGERRTRAT